MTSQLPPQTARALHAGAQQLLQVQAGWVLHVHSGSLLLRLPLAMEPALGLSDTVWQLSHRLAAGAVWVAQAPGWIRLDGTGQACLYTLQPASASWPSLASRLLQQLQKPRLRRWRTEPT